MLSSEDPGDLEDSQEVFTESVDDQRRNILTEAVALRVAHERPTLIEEMLNSIREKVDALITANRIARLAAPPAVVSNGRTSLDETVDITLSALEHNLWVLAAASSVKFNEDASVLMSIRNATGPTEEDLAIAKIEEAENAIVQEQVAVVPVAEERRVTRSALEKERETRMATRTEKREIGEDASPKTPASSKTTPSSTPKASARLRNHSPGDEEREKEREIKKRKREIAPKPENQPVKEEEKEREVDKEEEEKEEREEERFKSGSRASASGKAEKKTADPAPFAPVYCICKGTANQNSDMIGCDQVGCVIDWYHFECVGIRRKPKGKWYCPSCRHPDNPKMPKTWNPSKGSKK